MAGGTIDVINNSVHNSKLKRSKSSLVLLTGLEWVFSVHVNCPVQSSQPSGRVKSETIVKMSEISVCMRETC